MIRQRKIEGTRSIVASIDTSSFTFDEPRKNDDQRQGQNEEDQIATAIVGYTFTLVDEIDGIIDQLVEITFVCSVIVEGEVIYERRDEKQRGKNQERQDSDPYHPAKVTFCWWIALFG